MMSLAGDEPPKIYIVDTSVLVSAPEALQHLAAGNTVVIPFPVLQELDRRPARFSNPLVDQQDGKTDGGTHSTVADLLEKNVLEVAPINYLRGRSIHDAVIIVDDGQNLTQEDMKLVLTRAGEGTRVILTGDPDQIDRAEVDALSNGLIQVVERFKGEPAFAHLTMREVVRSQIAALATRLL